MECSKPITIGPYEYSVTQKLGSGSFGTGTSVLARHSLSVVFLGKCRSDDTPCAIKRIKLDTLAQTDLASAILCLEREIQISLEVSHPNLVSTHWAKKVAVNTLAWLTQTDRRNMVSGDGVLFRR